MHPYVYSSIINNSQTMKRAQCPSTDKEDVVYHFSAFWLRLSEDDMVYIMEYFSAIKKNEILPFATR